MEMYNYIGDNAPNYRIELSGANDFNENLIEKHYNNSVNTSLPVKMGDDYVIASINSDGNLQLDIFKTNKFLYGDFEADEVVIYDDIKSYDRDIIPIKNLDLHRQCIEATVLDSGELQIYVNKIENNWAGAYCISGMSYNDLSFKSVIYQRNFKEEITGTIQRFGISRPYKTRIGYIVLPIETTYTTDNKFFKRLEIYMSEDKGKGWEYMDSIGTGSGIGLVQKVNGFFPFNDKGYLIVTYSTRSNTVLEYNNDGTFNKVVYQDYGHDFRFLFDYSIINGDYIILAGFDEFSFYRSTRHETFMDLIMYAYAEQINLPKLNKGKEYLKTITIDNKILAITVSRVNGTYFTVIEPLKTAINQDVIDISIDRPKNMIGSATIKLNNYMAKYSPDGNINPYKLFPNKEVIIYLGYGKDLKKAFTGYIDSIQMNSFPHIITIQCRDTLKLCKDQLLYYNNKYTHVFKNRTPENLFRILCNAAGVRYGTVEKTGIRLAEVEWNYVSVYDCMEEIAELSGFELSCDENGVLHFREEKPKENQPIVKKFKEGKNITTLDYSIDDSELYHSVIAQGKKEKEITVKNKKGKKVKKKVEEIISYREYWGPRNFYNLPKNKILVVDANEADNKTDLKKVVDQALYLMTCRARQVSFEAIADTSLKVGDMIRVEETGSTISEVYRITGIGFDLNNSGYTMSIECYHHRNFKPEEDKEE